MRSHKGLTLLELLVVVFILSSIALLTVSVVDSADEQLRYDETRSRLELVKRGIAGEPWITVNGEPKISGFVADMGRLPKHLEELMTPFLSTGDALPEWDYCQEAGLWSGWRGPYIEPLLEKDEFQNPLYTFRDGWKNPGSVLENFGWRIFNVEDNTLFMQSFGSDNTTGGEGYAADYPPDILCKLVDPKDIQVDIRQLSMRVTYTNNLSTTRLRLRVVYPREGLVDPSNLPLAVFK